jgi:hypothetical protein
MKILNWENFLNENIDIENSKKLEILRSKFKNEFNYYYKKMNYRIMSVLVLQKESEYELTRKHENNVRRILNKY